MRIALFTDTFVPQINGVARTLDRLVQHLTERGHLVALIGPDLGPPESTVALQIGLPGIRLPFYPELRLCRPLDQTSARRLRAFAPDVVHVATEFPVGWSGLLWAKDRHLPIVTSFHTDFPAYLASYGFGGIESWAWRYLNRFHARGRVTLCPSRATLSQLRGAGFQGDLRIWSRGVDPSLFDAARRDAAMRERLAPGADLILLYVGRIATEKRLDLLVDAFEAVRSRTTCRVALSLVGDGPHLAALRGRAPEGVSFCGYLNGDTLAAAYASADIFAFPSDTETFGNVVLEAASSGLPLVAPDRGGVTETVIPHRSGLLFEPGNAGSLADALLRLIEDAELRSALGAGARALALGRSWATILDGVIEIYANEVLRTTMRAA